MCVFLLGYFLYFSPTDLIKCNHVDYINQEVSDHLFLHPLSSFKSLSQLFCSFLLSLALSLSVDLSLFFSETRRLRSQGHDNEASFEFE